MHTGLQRRKLPCQVKDTVPRPAAAAPQAQLFCACRARAARCQILGGCTGEQSRLLSCMHACEPLYPSLTHTMHHNSMQMKVSCCMLCTFVAYPLVTCLGTLTGMRQ